MAQRRLDEQLTPGDHARQLFVESPLCHPSVMLRAEALVRAGGYRDGDFPEDYDLWLRLDAAGYGLAKLPDVLLAGAIISRAQRCGTRATRERGSLPEGAAPRAQAARHARPIDVWGAGATGKQLARALEPHGVRAQRFIDIDPRKIGGSARGAPVVAPEHLAAPGERWVVVALGARGARDEARGYLNARGHREGQDYLCAA